MRSRLLLLALLLPGIGSMHALAHPPAIPKAPLVLQHPLQDKNFYLLSLLQRNPAVHAALLHDPTLSKLMADRSAAQSNLTALLHGPAITYIQPFLWTAPQIQAVGDALRVLYRTNSDLRALVSGPLRHSGTASLSNAKSDEDMLVAAWVLDAQGINGILQTYGLGRPPLYPKIDSVSYDPASEDYREVLHQIDWTVTTTDPKQSLLFEPSLHFALYLLKINRRDEAQRFEPLSTGENAAAVARIPEVDWSKYPYSVVLIPGIGPENPNAPLSPMGVLHVANAARRYREGKAPFILVSGGFVHPSQTRYSEAIEMKRALMQDYGIPENAIIVDPHARHTTTNFRNAARLMYRYNIPFDKPALVAGDIYQSEYIENANLVKRCLRELGYPCFLDLHRVSSIGLVWLPTMQSLQQNPADPLDP
jgi:hypothetical protein